MDFNAILELIAREIPFLLFMVLLVYVFWIRPKRKANQLKTDPDHQTQIGDEILFADGLVGLITKYKDGIVYVESGNSHSKFQIKEDMFLKNLSKEERVKNALKKKNLWQKILSIL